MKPYFFLLSAELAWPNDSFELPYNFLERLDHIKKVKSILFWNFLKLFLFFFICLFWLKTQFKIKTKKNLCKN